MRRPILTLLLLVFTATAYAAPPRPRPYSGCGVLLVETDPATGGAPLVLYQEPGVARVVETAPAALPRLAGWQGEPLVAVSRRKGAWARIAYDDAGREGWLEQARRWQYLPWQEFLPGLQVSPLPGLKSAWYAVRSEPREGALELAHLGRDRAARVLQVAGDWVSLEAPAGWFRWRDADGRLTISLRDADQREKR